MRKRAVGLLLSATLSLSLFGCGNAAEPKQEEVQEDVQEVQQETKQEEVKTDAGTEQEASENVEQENDYSDLIGKEFENDDIYIKIDVINQIE